MLSGDRVCELQAALGTTVWELKRQLKKSILSISKREMVVLFGDQMPGAYESLASVVGDADRGGRQAPLDGHVSWTYTIIMYSIRGSSV